MHVALTRSGKATRWRAGIFVGWVLLQALSTAAFAQHIVEIDDTVEQRDFMPYDLTILIDTTNTMTLGEVRRATFHSNQSYQNKDFKKDASYWIRFPIRHNSHSEKIWLLEFYDQTIDHLDAWIPSESGGYKHLSLGDQQPFGQRMFMHKNFEFVLDMERDTVMNYYFRVRSQEFADIRVGLRSVNHFVYYALNEYFLFGMFYGMIMIIVVYNLLVYFAIREIKNIYYILYLVSVAAYAMSYDGIGFQYLWPNHPEFNNYAVGIVLYSVIVWALVFTRRFLSTRANAPQLDRALQGMIIARTIFFLGELFLFPQYLTLREVEIVPLSLIFYTGIRVLNRGYRPARFFVIAYGILFTGFFIRSLVYFNVLPFNTPLHYSLHFAFVLEMLFLTFALGDRIRILKDMRDRAMKRIIHQHEVNMKLKDKVAHELEEKVRERTLELNKKNAELEALNQKLVQQSDEINQINSMLDLDNWKLKNSIREVLNERLMDKAMDYKQFQTLYPDMLACHRFLENLKWEHGYSCRKCGNEKYFNGARKFSRRCSRCGYNESITAYTIFHSIKFPIEKAFYIAYLVVARMNRGYTLEDLATQLDLRLNTVWAFRQKVQERLAELETHGLRPTASRWEEVILMYERPRETLQRLQALQGGTG